MKNSKLINIEHIQNGKIDSSDDDPAAMTDHSGLFTI